MKVSLVSYTLDGEKVVAISAKMSRSRKGWEYHEKNMDKEEVDVDQGLNTTRVLVGFGTLGLYLLHRGHIPCRLASTGQAQDSLLYSDEPQVRQAEG